MKKRICYDYYFLPKNNFEFNGEEIRGVSLTVKFRIFINSARTLVTLSNEMNCTKKKFTKYKTCGIICMMLK